MTHSATASLGAFDERRVGRDHVAFRVTDPDELPGLANAASDRKMPPDSGVSADRHGRSRCEGSYLFLAIRPSTILLKSAVPNDTYSARFA